MSLSNFKNSARKAQMIMNGHEPIPPEQIPAEHTQCPICGIVYKYSKPAKQGVDWEREQHISGICSEKCWDNAFNIKN
jgi:hypothetical protein